MLEIKSLRVSTSTHELFCWVKWGGVFICMNEYQSRFHMHAFLTLLQLLCIKNLRCDYAGWKVRNLPFLLWPNYVL